MVGACGVPGLHLDLQRAPEQVHVTGDAVDGDRLPERAHARLHLSGARLTAAQQVEQVGGVAVGAEALLHVGDGGVALAQLPPSECRGRHGSSTGAGSSIVLSAWRSRLPGARRSCAAEVSGSWPASRL